MVASRVKQISFIRNKSTRFHFLCFFFRTFYITVTQSTKNGITSLTLSNQFAREFEEGKKTGLEETSGEESGVTNSAQCDGVSVGRRLRSPPLRVGEATSTSTSISTSI
jgi:hypothetical protein